MFTHQVPEHTRIMRCRRRPPGCTGLPPRLPPQSFPLSEEEYEAQLQAVADYLNLWEVQERVRAGIKNANKRGPGARDGRG